jgi:uncharacterized membrane protein
MSKNNRKKNQDKIAAKKAAVLGTPKSKKLPLIAGIIGAAIIFGAAIFIVTGTGGNDTVVATVPVSTNSTFISFPASTFDDGKAHHFEHVDGKHTIKYFILKSSDGVIRAAFDACDVCWPAGKGYYQDGDHMVCRNCGQRFASVRINEVKGGCNPAPLNRKVKDGNLVIEIKDIREGRRYFDFG